MPNKTKTSARIRARQRSLRAATIARLGRRLCRARGTSADDPEPSLDGFKHVTIGEGPCVYNRGTYDPNGTAYAFRFATHLEAHAAMLVGMELDDFPSDSPELHAAIAAAAAAARAAHAS